MTVLRFWSLKFGYFEFIWDLVLGAWNLPPFRGLRVLTGVVQ